MERYRGRLGSFRFTVQHMPGNKMPCDYGSRHPDALPANITKDEMVELGIETEEAYKEIWVSRILEAAIPSITLDAMPEAMAKDPELVKILDEKRNARKSTATSKGPFRKIWDEVHKWEGILIRGKPLVVPKTLQAQARQPTRPMSHRRSSRSHKSRGKSPRLTTRAQSDRRK